MKPTITRLGSTLILLALCFNPVDAQTPVWMEFSSKKWGVCEPITGAPATAAIFDEARATYQVDTLARVKKNGRAGIYASSGRIVIPVRYDEVFDDFQTGIKIGFAGAQLGGQRGLWNIKTGLQVLPLEFEYVRAIWPDILVARRKGSKTLEFFDQNGQKKFEAPGHTAWPGYDDTTIEVFDEARNRFFLDKKGQPVFSERHKNARWTDGKTVVVASLNTSGSFENLAILTWAGDTILGQSNFSFIPLGAGRFFLRDSKTAQIGLFDASGKWLIPLGGFGLSKQGEPGDPNAAIYAHKSGFAEGHQLFDAAGKLLFDNCRLTKFTYEPGLALTMPVYRPNKYFQLELVGRANTCGLFTADGQMLVPMEFGNFEYCSDLHPVIARRNHPTQLSEDQYWLFDLKTGERLFAEAFQNIRFSKAPKRFWAKKLGLWGVIEQGKISKARFEFDEVRKLTTGCIAARKGTKWVFFNPEAVQLGTAMYEDVLSPSRIDFEQYRPQKKSHSRLIGIGILQGKPYAIWLGDDGSAITSSIHPELPADPPPPEDVDTALEPPPTLEGEVPISTEEANTEKPVFEMASSDRVYEFADLDVVPAFPGGAAIVQFIDDNLKYPQEAKAKKIQGWVKVTFTVEKDGRLTDINITENLGGGCGQEALRIVQAMPNWIPGAKDGKIVRAKHTIAIPFKLN